MADSKDAGPPERTVADRWWAEFGDKQRDTPKRPAGPAGTSFFRAGIGFEQERARARLTDNNLKLLVEADPPLGGWGYVQLAETTFPAAERERLTQAVNIPSYARGAVVDCGLSVRLLLTGTPIGGRILELALGDAPSFDCWIDGEWVHEEVFSSTQAAVAALRQFIRQYLSPEGIAEWESLRARA